MRLLAVALCVGLAAIAARAEPAAACSCAGPIDARSALRSAHGAFVGRLIEKRDLGGGPSGEAIFVFRVERSIKGRLGETIEVRSSASSASCGLDSELGRRVGLLLRREEGKWHSGLCMQVTPRELIAAARPLPRPDGRGPLAMLVGGGFGNVRTIGLDRRGRTLAYGRGAGRTILFSACPRSRRFAEVAVTGQSRVLAVRDRRLRVVWTRVLPAGPGDWPQAVSCRDPGGSEVLVFLAGGERRASIWSFRGNGRAAIWRGAPTAAVAAFGPTHAYVSADDRVLGVELATGRPRTLIRLRSKLLATLALSPDGRALAGIVAATGGRLTVQLAVIRLGARATLRSIRLAHPDVEAEVAWWRSTRIVFLPRWGRGAVRVFDRSLRLRRRFGAWPMGNAIIVGDRAVGVRQDEVVTLRLSDGRFSRLRRLPGSATHTIAAAQP